MEYKGNLVLAEACGIHTGDGYLRSDEENRRELDISGSIDEKDLSLLSENNFNKY